MTPTQSVLFVCMGNICRSPLAEGLFRRELRLHGQSDAFVVDSAGTHDYHVGSAPDERAVAVARSHGVDISAQRTRQLTARDFDDFDHIYVMDHTNLRDALRIRPEGARSSAELLLERVLGDPEAVVHDPYGGGRAEFEQCFRMLEMATRALRGILLATR